MAEQNVKNNPWKGLNYYVEGEVLYGRNREIESLSHYIINNTQTVLYGKSGIGKSSILNAGIFPIARRQGMVPVGIRLDHGKTALPYLAQIRQAIERSGVTPCELLPVIDAEQETLWEYLHRNTFADANGQTVCLLLVFDQFEEIFTLQQDEQRKRQFFEELAALFNDVTPLYILGASPSGSAVAETDAQEVTGSLDELDIDLDTQADERSSGYLEQVDYHVVFTLREDFLSYLERYTAFIPVMKSNRYALLPLNGEQAADIVMLPRKGLVSRDVAQLIIQKVTGRPDFVLGGVSEIEVDAAVLSLYLSRLYIKKGDGEEQISAELVSQFSDDIIKDFYEECVADLPVPVVAKIEEELLTYDGRRNNVSRYDLESEGVPPEVIDRLVYDKKLLRQYNDRGNIRLEFMHDILCPIVDQRSSQREQAQRQEEERQRQEEERRLFMAQEKQRRHEIERRAAKANEQKLAVERQAALARRRNRRRVGWLVALLAFIVLAIVGRWYFFLRPWSDYYAGFTCQNGWPVGVGPEVGRDGGDSMVVYYRLTRYGAMPPHLLGMSMGSSRHYVQVQVVRQGAQPTTNKLVEEPLVALDEAGSTDEQASLFATMQLKTVRWVYTPDADGNVARRTAYNADGQALYIVQYFRSDNVSIVDGATRQTNTLWANYTDAEGKALRVRGNGADRMRITVDSAGYYSTFQFYNEQGLPRKNSRQAYGYRYDVAADGTLAAMTPIDAYGRQLTDQRLRFTTFDEYHRWIAALTENDDTATASYLPDAVVFAMPDRRDTLRYNADGNLVYRSCDKQGARQTLAYNDRQQLVEERSYLHDILTSYRQLAYANQDSDTPTEELTYNRNYSYPYEKVMRLTDGATETERHYHGRTPDALLSCNISDDVDYHRLVTEETASDTLYTTHRLTYYAVDSLGNDEHLVRQVMQTVDRRTGLTKRERETDAEGRIVLSMEYDIEDGRVVGQHVLGLCGDTIRCPQWDLLGLNYYTMRFVRDFNDEIVAAMAFDERGEEMTIIDERGWRWSLRLASGGDDVQQVDTDDRTCAIVSTVKYVEERTRVKLVGFDYIHITDTTGTAYQAGLRDGDVLLANDGQLLRLARRVKGTATYEVQTLSARLSDLTGMEPPYTVYFNLDETLQFNTLTNR